jgi:hypothetical protein
VKTNQELEQAGFTAGGVKRYQRAVTDYSKALYDRAMVLAEAQKDPGANIEVTLEHVRDAAKYLNATYGREEPSRSAVLMQVGEYFFTALVGVGGGNLKQTWGILTFGLSIAIGVILFVIRNTKFKS